MQNATDVDVVFQRNDIGERCSKKSEKIDSEEKRLFKLENLHIKGGGNAEKRDHGLGFLIPLTAW